MILIWLLTCVIWSTVWFFIKVGVTDLPPITFAVYRLAVALLVTLALIVEGNPTTVEWTGRAIVALLYLAILGSVVATWLNYWLLKRIEATKVLVMGIAEVPLAMLVGAAWLGETVSARALVGAICVLAGVSVVMEVVRLRPQKSVGAGPASPRP